MQPLIDADVLRYEIGFAAEAGWQQPGFPPFEYAANLLDLKIANICAITQATEKPILYITGSTNFRTEVAKTFIYKDRLGNKPFHYKNLTAYMKAVYDVRMQEGLEADDLMSIEQTKRPDETIICTRDKDLRITPGWHFGWELGNQPQFGPRKIDEFGWIELTEKRKVVGGGYLFFLAQCILGDSVDTVPGLPKFGPVKAFKILEGSKDIPDAFNRVLEAYRGIYDTFAEERLLEMGRCLWMVRELNENSEPVMWQFPVIPDATTTPIPVLDQTV